jgi:hypothetical protein
VARGPPGPPGACGGGYPGGGGGPLGGGGGGGGGFCYPGYHDPMFFVSTHMQKVVDVLLPPNWHSYP